MKNEIYDPWFCENFSSPLSVLLKGFSYCPTSGFDINVYEEGNPDKKITIRFKELPIATRITVILKAALSSISLDNPANDSCPKQ